MIGVGFVFIDVRAAAAGRRRDVEEEDEYIRLRVVVSEAMLFAVDDRVSRIGGERLGVIFDLLLLLCLMVL
jgi:hypothetical protein